MANTWLNWPNRITIGRIALVGPLVICLLNLDVAVPHVRRLALALLIIMSLSDAVDGFLARRMNEESALGRFLDPVADKLLISCAVVILAIESIGVPGFTLPNWVPVIALGKDVVVVIGFLLIYLVTGAFFVEPRVWGKACTLVQLVMLATILVAPDLPVILQRLVPALWGGASGLAVVAMVDYFVVGNRFAARRHQAHEESSDEPDSST
jgi:CDP-diacylglycerol--glycerol-3-phosphate 3-phosphatidyltransferase